MKRSIPHHDSRCSSCLVFVAVAVTALCVVTRSDAFPDGVPLNSCVDNMAYAIPPYAHLTKPSVFTVTTGYTSGNGNFQYSFSDTAWQAGVPFTLMINQTVPTASKSSIRGFFYQAFDSNRNRVGSWTFSPVLYNNATPLGRTIDCPNGQAVSHTIALGNGNTALRPKTLNLTVLINTPGVGTITIEGITLTDRVVYFQNSNLPPIPERVVAGVPATFVEPTAPPASLGYTMAEVAKHNTSVTGCSTTCPVTSCWIVLFGNVFNATDWAHYHASDASGGPIPCGTDSTLAYMNVSTHRPERIGLYDYYLGPLIGYVATANETINTPTTAPQVGTVLSVASVAQHNTTSSCWVIINQGVYDITAFIPIHQGGSLITIACGTNATALYALTPLHQVGLLPYRTKYLGALNAVITAAPTTAAPTTSAPTTASPTTSNACPSACNGRGRCLQTTSTCLCSVGWVGPSCSVAALTPLICVDDDDDLKSPSTSYTTLKSTTVTSSSLAQSFPSSARFCFQYAYDSTYFHASMYGQNNGYVSMLFGADGDGMSGGFGWVGLLSPSPTSDMAGVLEVFSTSVDTSPQAYDATVQALLVGVSGGTVNGSLTQFQFSRRLAPFAGVPTSIPQPGPVVSMSSMVNNLTWTSMSYALGTSQMFVMHQYAGQLNINLMTGSATSFNPIDYWRIIYGPTVAWVMFIALVSVLLLLCQQQSSQNGKDSKPTFIARIGAAFLTRPLARWSPSSTPKFDPFFSPTLRVITGLRWLDVVALASTVVWFGVVLGLGMKEYHRVGLTSDFVWAQLLSVTLAFTLLPTTRHSILAWLMGSSFERLVLLHKWMGRASFVLVWVHFGTMAANFGSSSYDLFSENSISHGVGVYPGMISLIAINIMVIFALACMRRRLHELFYLTHMFCFVVAMGGAWAHSQHFRYYAAGPLILWVLDHIWRVKDWSSKVVKLKAARVHVSPDLTTVTEMEIHVNHFDYNPGQYVFLNIPKVSWFEWHPMSPSSYLPQSSACSCTCSCDSCKKNVTAHTSSSMALELKEGEGHNGHHNCRIVKFHLLDMGTGGWSNRLSQLVRKFAVGLGDEFMIRMDGPYGKLQIQPQNYQVIVLCGAGIGTTPIMSLAMFLYDVLVARPSAPYTSTIKAVHLVLTCSQFHHLEQWYATDLNKLRSPAASQLFVVHLYATNHKQQDVARIRTALKKQMSLRHLPSGSGTVSPYGGLNGTLNTASLADRSNSDTRKGSKTPLNSLLNLAPTVLVKEPSSSDIQSRESSPLPPPPSPPQAPAPAPALINEDDHPVHLHFHVEEHPDSFTQFPTANGSSLTGTSTKIELVTFHRRDQNNTTSSASSSGSSSPISNHRSPTNGVTSPRLVQTGSEMGDWREFVQMADEFTEFTGHTTLFHYWLNTKTGQTSLTPPLDLLTSSTNGNGNGHVNGDQYADSFKATLLAHTTDYTSADHLSQNRSIDEELQHLNIKFGRPDMLSLFKSIKRVLTSANEDADKCGVYMCGPKLFMDSVQHAADQCDFHTHREYFGF